jgi:uncharacterized protein
MGPSRSHAVYSGAHLKQRSRQWWIHSATFVDRLIDAYLPERVYLFGSMARGDVGPDSDYDLLLVVPDDAPPERQRSRLAYQTLRGTGVAADILVLTRSRFETRARVATSLPATVLREGKLLHAA